MSLTTLIAQDGPMATLRSLVADGRLPHALLFHGPTGVGKATAAIALAQALVCATPADDASEGSPRTTACGACRPCRWVA